MLKGCDSDAERCTLYLENMLKQVREESEERREERREEERGEKGRRGGGVDGGSSFTSSSSSRWLTKRDVDVCLKQLSDVVGREEVNVLLRKNADVMEELQERQTMPTSRRKRRGQQLGQPGQAGGGEVVTSRNDDETQMLRTELLSRSSINRLLSSASGGATASKRVSTLLSELCASGDSMLAYDLYRMLLEEGGIMNLHVRNVLLHGLLESGEMERATDLFAEMTRDADRRSPRSPRPFSVAPTASEYYTSKVKAAGNVTSSARPLLTNQADAVTYTTMIRGLLYNEGNHDSSSSGSSSSSSSVRDNNNSGGHGNECDRAIALFHDMERHGIPRDRECFHTLIHGLCRRGMPERAWKVFEEMGDVGLRDRMAYTTMLLGFIARGELQIARELFEEMGLDVDTERDVAVYDVMMRGYLDDGDLENAWSIFEECEKHEIVRDASLYSTLVGGLCRHYERAMNEQRMRRHQFGGDFGNDDIDGGGGRGGGGGGGGGGGSSRPFLSIMPTVRVNANLLLSDAVALFDEMGESGLERDVLVHTQLMRALCRAGKVEEAWNVFEQMKNEKIAVPKVSKEKKQGVSWKESGGEEEEEKGEEEYVEVPMEVDAVAYTTILKGLCGVGQLKRAMQVFDEMGENEIKDERRQQQPLAGGGEGGEEDKRRKKPLVVDLHAYTTMISGLVKRKHRMQEGQVTGDDSGLSSGGTAAASVVDEVEDEGWSDVDRTGQIWMLEEEEHQENIEHAWSLFEEGRRKGHQMDGRAYSTMLSGLARLEVGGMRRAESLFREMERNHSVNIDGQSYRAMIESCINDGTSEGDERAMLYFENMMETWSERGIQDRDLAVVESLMVERMGEERWDEMTSSHRAAIEGIALGPGKTNMVRLPRILRNKF